MAIFLKTETAKSISNTAEALTAINRAYPSIVIQASPDNNKGVAVGDSTVTFANGIVLDAGDVMEIVGTNRQQGGMDELIPSDIFVIAETAVSQVIKFALIARRSGTNP